KKIAAGDTIMVSVNDLQQSQIPDKVGNRIPVTAQMGGMNIWSRSIHNGLVINAMLVNPVTKTCGECGVDGYVDASTLSDNANQTSANPVPMTYAPGEQFIPYIILHWTSGRVDFEEAVITNSSNPSVADANGIGSVECYSPGATNLTGRTNNSYPSNSSC